MSKGLTPGAMLPDFTLPDETGTMRSLAVVCPLRARGPNV